MDYSQPTYPASTNTQSAPQAPITSGNDDIILVQAEDNRKRWPLILGIALAIIAVIVVAILIFVPKASEGGVASINQDAYTLMKDSYKDITNIQQTFIDLRDGYYSSASLFSDDTHSYINEMGEKMTAFHQDVAKINSSKITEPLAKENIEKLKAYLDSVVPIYTKTVELYNQYYESGEHNSPTIVQDIFAAYTNTEEFTSVYFYEIMGDLIAELQDHEGSE